VLFNQGEQTMKNSMIGLAVLLLLLAGTMLCAAEHPQLKAFPPAEKGFERFVIVLPDKERGEEDNFKVELVAGKTIPTDGVNRNRLGVNIVAQPVKGWGYTMYKVTGDGAVMSTMMAAPENSPKVDTFVQGTPLMIRYNSRLPIVVYAPQGYEVRYRIWSSGEMQKAEKE
jgi:ecotin